MRGRPLRTIDDLRTRPMKDRVREAVFNLVGPAIKGKHGIDLFAGSGALGLESLSRGAAHATLIERHFPTADLIRENVRALGVEQRADVVAADAFLWARLDLPESTVPWVVFCSPPYDFYVDRGDDMVQLIERLRRSAPDGSRIVVESDLRFDTDLLPLAEAWDVRTYGQARVSLLITPEGKTSEANPAPPVG